MRASHGLFLGLLVAGLAFALTELSGKPAQEPPSHSGIEAGEQADPNARSAGPAEPVDTQRLAGDESDEFPLVSDPTRASDPSRALRPLAVRVVGPEEWIAGIPVALVSPRNPSTDLSSEARLRTDETGVAHAQLQADPALIRRYVADLAFPTLGASVTPLPAEGGEVEIGAPVPSSLRILVTENGGPPLQTVELEVRSPLARVPAERWHRYRSLSGEFELSAEAEIQLEGRVTLASGHTETFEVRSAAPEESLTHRVDCVHGYETTLQVFGSNGRLLFDTALSLGMAGSTRTRELRTDVDAKVTVRLPESEEPGDAPRFRLRAHLDGSVEQVEFAASQADAGTVLPLHLRAATEIVTGQVRDHEDLPVPGIEVRVGFVGPPPIQKAGETPAPVFQILEVATTDAEGRFTAPIFDPEPHEELALAFRVGDQVVRRSFAPGTHQEIELERPAESNRGSLLHRLRSRR